MSRDVNSNIILITGGTKSGKSEFAEYMAITSKNLTYIALSESRPEDEQWKKKVSLHRKRRPKNWSLIETNNLLKVLKNLKDPVLIDSIGGFIMESINKTDEEWNKNLILLLNLLKNRSELTIIVGEQVGWSLVSEYEIGNRYIERMGELQKNISSISQENWLALNGKAIKLDNISIDIPL